eukprot:1422529-Prymnesium_polylepis.1
MAIDMHDRRRRGRREAVRRSLLPDGGAGAPAATRAELRSDDDAKTAVQSRRHAPNPTAPLPRSRCRAAASGVRGGRPCASVAVDGAQQAQSPHAH